MVRNRLPLLNDSQNALCKKRLVILHLHFSHHNLQLRAGHDYNHSAVQHYLVTLDLYRSISKKATASSLH